MTERKCDNMMCSWREPWKPFGFQTHHINGQDVTLCANCMAIWLSEKAGGGEVTLGTPENNYTLYRDKEAV